MAISRIPSIRHTAIYINLFLMLAPSSAVSPDLPDLVPPHPGSFSDTLMLVRLSRCKLCRLCDIPSNHLGLSRVSYLTLGVLATSQCLRLRGSGLGKACRLLQTCVYGSKSIPGRLPCLSIDGSSDDHLIREVECLYRLVQEPVVSYR
jgi:hypothetical protein